MNSEWQDIETAPKNTEVLVCRYVGDEWRMGQSGLYFDVGDHYYGEPGYWYWSNDNCQDCLVEDEGPDYWMPLPPPPTDPRTQERKGGE